MAERRLIKLGTVQELQGWFVLLTCDRTGQEYVASAGRYPEALAKYGTKAYGEGNYRVCPCGLKVVLTGAGGVQPGPQADTGVPF